MQYIKFRNYQIKVTEHGRKKYIRITWELFLNQTRISQGSTCIPLSPYTLTISIVKLCCRIKHSTPQMCWDQKRRVRTPAICYQISLPTLISRLTEQLIDHSMLERLLEEISTFLIKKTTHIISFQQLFWKCLYYDS